MERIRQEDKDAFERAARCVMGGGIVLIPTETYYGLSARYDDETALSRLSGLKGREIKREKPFPLIIGETGLLGMIAQDVSGLERELMERFWPGPLTIVFKAKEGFPSLSMFISTGQKKVAVRMPGPSAALSIARLAGVPLTATSANPSGLPPAASARKAASYFAGGGVDILVDGGELPVSRPSTIIEAGPGDLIRILREGAVPRLELERFFARVE